MLGSGQAPDYGKCGGILAEVINGESTAVVLGIGLNVSQRADELPTDRVAFPATSLALAGGAGGDRDPLVRALLRTLASWYGRWVEVGGDPRTSGLGEAYRSHCLTLGRPVSVASPGGGQVSGTASDIDDDGRLIIVTATGPRAMAAGDVRHVR
jgi:BirA family biotin operon repressor/biotin-[acetyl-CoA-carboxylase] ligase